MSFNYFKEPLDVKFGLLEASVRDNTLLLKP